MFIFYIVISMNCMSQQADDDEFILEKWKKERKREKQKK